MKKVKQTAALIAVILLAGVYIATLLAAIFSPADNMRLFAICLFCTVAIPLLAFIFIWVYGRTFDKKIIGDPEEPGSQSAPKSTGDEEPSENK